MAIAGVSTVPPKSVRDRAKRAIEKRKQAPKSKKGGLTPAQASKQGIKSGVTSARMLASGKGLSEDRLKAVRNFINRMGGIVKSEKGKNALALWGGKEAGRWAAATLRKIENARKNKKK